MQKFIISVKDKNTGRDVISTYIVNSLNGLGNYSERVSSLGLLLLWIRLKKKLISLSCHVNLNYLNPLVMNRDNFWKIVIGAISAALGYVLNAIGL